MIDFGWHWLQLHRIYVWSNWNNRCIIDYINSTRRRDICETFPLTLFSRANHRYLLRDTATARDAHGPHAAGSGTWTPSRRQHSVSNRTMSYLVGGPVMIQSHCPVVWPVLVGGAGKQLGKYSAINQSMPVGSTTKLVLTIAICNKQMTTCQLRHVEQQQHEAVSKCHSCRQVCTPDIFFENIHAKNP